MQSFPVCIHHTDIEHFVHQMYCDAVVSAGSNDASDKQTAIPNTRGHSSVEKYCSSCRCGQGGAENKQSRLFCENCEPGCRVFEV